MINNRFLFFKTLSAFLRELLRHNINSESIAFILDQKLIWNRGTYYGQTEYSNDKNKGFFENLTELKNQYPKPKVGDWAIVLDESAWYLCFCRQYGVWTISNQTYDHTGNNLLFATKQELSGVQYTLQQFILNQITDLNNDLTPTIRSKADKSELGQYLKISDLDLLNYITRQDLENYIIQPEIDSQLIQELIQQYVSGLDIDQITVDRELSVSSTNPVLNKAITIELLKKLEESDLQGYIKAEDISDLIAIDADEIWSAIRQKAGVSDVSAIQSRLDTYDQVVLPNKVDRDELVNYALKSEFETEVNTYVTEIIRVAEKAKGYYDSYADLIQAVSNPEIGDWAVISSNGRWVICKCSTNGVWTETSQEYAEEAPDLNAYAKKSDLDSYTPLSNFNQYVSTFNLHVSTASTLYATKSELIAGLDSNRQYTNDNLYDAKVELQNLINSLTAQLNVIKEKYISWYGSQEGSHDGDLEPVPTYNSNMVTLSEVQYQALVQAGKVDPDTYYFTYNAADYPTTWTFGNKFPITFTEQWAFGGTFPITLR